MRLCCQPRLSSTPQNQGFRTVSSQKMSSQVVQMINRLDQRQEINRMIQFKQSSVEAIDTLQSVNSFFRVYPSAARTSMLKNGIEKFINTSPLEKQCSCSRNIDTHNKHFERYRLRYEFFLRYVNTRKSSMSTTQSHSSSKVRSPSWAVTI